MKYLKQLFLFLRSNRINNVFPQWMDQRAEKANNAYNKIRVINVVVPTHSQGSCTCSNCEGGGANLVVCVDKTAHHQWDEKNQHTK